MREKAIIITGGRTKNKTANMEFFLKAINSKHYEKICLLLRASGTTIADMQNFSKMVNIAVQITEPIKILTEQAMEAVKEYEKLPKRINIYEIEKYTMKINGFEYTESEVLDALRSKGYLILPFRTHIESHLHGSSFIKEWYDTKCAVKGPDLPSDENIWSNVAIREFQKGFVKPKLT